MSYRITIKANAGTLAVFGEGDIPNGEFVLSVETGPLTVEQRNELGHPIGRALPATAYHQPDDDDRAGHG